MKKSINKELVHFLSDMYSVELQALVQMKAAPQIAGAPPIADDFRKHYDETEVHAQLMHERLTEHGASSSAIKDAVMKLGGTAFVLFARLQPETPGKLLTHAYSYEAMEWAAYEMLLRFAEQANDYKTVEAAQLIKAQELAMLNRVKGHFEIAEEITHSKISKNELENHLKRHLSDAHALAEQSKKLLSKSQEIAGNQHLNEIYKDHLILTEKHSKLIENHLIELGSHVSKLKDSALTLGGVNWGLFFQYQSDTPAKLAAFVYAILYLEMGGYELLERTAFRCGDQHLVKTCHSILKEKQGMAQTLAEALDSAAQATLDLL